MDGISRRNFLKGSAAVAAAGSLAALTGCSLSAKKSEGDVAENKEPVVEEVPIPETVPGP